jgi:hypothetical protein
MKPNLIARRPFRLWMTGSFAVVMAALVPLREVGAEERSTTLRVLRHSRFDVLETLQRIEDAARGQGLGVLARIGGARPVIVLSSKMGGTPVVMQDADSQPDVPLSVLVRAASDGGADVLIATDQRRWAGFPSAAVDDLSALPGLVDQALL